MGADSDDDEEVDSEEAERRGSEASMPVHGS